MTKPRVYFIPVENYQDRVKLAHKFKSLIKAADICAEVKKNDLVAIKMTFGEKDNKGFIPPLVVKTLADKIKSLGAKPFVTDTNVIYHGRRSNSVEHLLLAEEHGFSIANLGCPVIIADGLLGENSRDVAINKKHFKSVKIAGSVAYLEHLISISHFTGHMLTNFGGTIKNIGMGLASRPGKLSQHSAVKPKILGMKCRACGQCFKVCPVEAIVEKQGLAFILSDKCIGCGECLAACKFEAVEVSWSEDAGILSEKMAEYAYGVVSCVKHIGFVNFAMHITKECDCLAKDDPDICPDLGIFASRDPVAVDCAVIDMLYKDKKEDWFKQFHPKGAAYTSQINHAVAIGLGSREYELFEVISKG